MEAFWPGLDGWLSFLIFPAVALAVFLCLRRGGGAGFPCMSSRGERRLPLDILEERFARGEIDKEEFDARLRVLVAPPSDHHGEAFTEKAPITQKEEAR